MIRTLPGRDPGHAGQQHAGAALRQLERVGAGLDRHAAGDRAHRREQRQAAAGVGHGLVGDRDAARRQQVRGLLGVGSEMQVGEQDLARAQTRPLLALRLLDLDDQLGGGEHLLGIVRDARPGALVHDVDQADGVACVGFDQDLMAVLGQLAHRCRGQADPVFVGLDFLRYADPHLPPLAATRM